MLSNHSKVPTSLLNEVTNSHVKKKKNMSTIIHHDSRYNLYQNVEVRGKVL